MATRNLAAPQKPAAKAAAAVRKPARERLLAAADELFYGEGINTVGIDRVIERAGVAKASLYDVFGSKEELIRAYLAERHDARVTRTEATLAKHTDPREKVLAIFDAQREFAAAGAFRGCAFVRAGTEMHAAPRVREVIESSRAWLRGLFRDLAKEAGAAHPEKVAQQLVILYDGASVCAQLDGRERLANVKAMAQMLLEAQLPPSRKRG
jgi:AcrR family transcriptional regulator